MLCRNSIGIWTIHYNAWHCFANEIYYYGRLTLSRVVSLIRFCDGPLYLPAYFLHSTIPTDCKSYVTWSSHIFFRLSLGPHHRILRAVIISTVPFEISWISWFVFDIFLHVPPSDKILLIFLTNVIACSVVSAACVTHLCASALVLHERLIICCTTGLYPLHCVYD